MPTQSQTTPVTVRQKCVDAWTRTLPSLCTNSVGKPHHVEPTRPPQRFFQILKHWPCKKHATTRPTSCGTRTSTVVSKDFPDMLTKNQPHHFTDLCLNLRRQTHHLNVLFVTLKHWHSNKSCAATCGTVALTICSQILSEICSCRTKLAI